MRNQVDGALVHPMSGTELSHVRTEFRLRPPEPINRSLLESRGPTSLCNQVTLLMSGYPCQSRVSPHFHGKMPPGVPSAGDDNACHQWMSGSGQDSNKGLSATRWELGLSIGILEIDLDDLNGFFWAGLVPPHSYCIQGSIDQ
jgi:hypothetical protein